MARLALPFLILCEARKKELKQRNRDRLMMRYMQKAFSMSADEFKFNYRITKELFDELYRELKPWMRTPRRRSEITRKYKILVALSFFATGSYQRLVGGTYGTLMSQQSVSRAIKDVTAALNHQHLLKKWIAFPRTREERDALKIRFITKFRIPAVLGCIDGTHVAIIRPTDNEERFFNRKHFHSRNVQIICDADLNVLSVDASFGGATHDSFIWNQHPVKNFLMECNRLGETVYLLGDSGFAQREYMMTPIIDAAVGSPEEYYTKLHCTARNTVERAIGVIKNRWRCLLRHRVLHYHPDVAAKIINACCVLHNICNKSRLDDIDLPLSQNDGAFGTETISIPNTPAAGSRAQTIELRRGIAHRANLVQQLWATRHY